MATSLGNRGWYVKKILSCIIHVDFSLTPIRPSSTLAPSRTVPAPSAPPCPSRPVSASPKAVPPYAALAASLRERVAGRNLAPGSWLGTEVALVAESGLSRMTVRRAVQALVDEGLVERRAGRGVFVRGGGAAAREVRVVAGNLLWAPAVRVAQAVQEHAPAAGFSATVFDGRGDLGAVVAEVRALPGSDAVGAVVMSQHDPAFNRALAELVAADFPFVVVDQTLADLPGASVASDNRTGGRLAAEALLAAGHKRLAFLGDLGADTTAERAQGVADACAAALVPPPVRLDVPGRRFADWGPAVRERVAELLGAVPRPTALACSCDAVALHAVRALSEAGVAVPRDMSVTGFDDDPAAEWCSPPLTTVRQDFSEMGRRALALVAAARSSSEPEPRHETVPVSLVTRASVAPPPAAAPGAVPASGRIRQTAKP